jgi:hypothetical protein
MLTRKSRVPLDSLQERTIRDFGEQWTAFPDNDGYYASLGLFHDFVSPLLDPESLRGLRVADIGSGTGRIVNMLLDAGAKSVLPSSPRTLSTRWSGIRLAARTG